MEVEAVLKRKYSLLIVCNKSSFFPEILDLSEAVFLECMEVEVVHRLSQALQMFFNLVTMDPWVEVVQARMITKKLFIKLNNF